MRFTYLNKPQRLCGLGRKSHFCKMILFMQCNWNHTNNLKEPPDLWKLFLWYDRFVSFHLPIFTHDIIKCKIPINFLSIFLFNFNTRNFCSVMTACFIIGGTKSMKCGTVIQGSHFIQYYTQRELDWYSKPDYVPLNTDPNTTRRCCQ